MSLSMCNQNIQWVIDNFKLAEKYDPSNPTISQNRVIAIARSEKKESTETWNLQTLSISDVTNAWPVEIGNEIAKKMECDFAPAA